MTMIRRDKERDNQTKTPRFYGSLATKLLFALLHSPNPSEVYSNQKIVEVIRVNKEQGYEQDFMEEIVVKWANGKAYIFSKSDYKYLNKKDIEDMKEFMTTSWGIESYQIKINLTTPTFTISDIEKLVPYFIITDHFIGIVAFDTPTRWVKFIPIKLNIFAWKVSLNRLPTRLNLVRRGVSVAPVSCSICLVGLEDLDHLFFGCNMASDIARSICKWWNLVWSPFVSYSSWLSWFKDIRMHSNPKMVLEGVFYTAWWSIWLFRNQLLFTESHPKKEVIFDDIVRRSFLWCSSRGKQSFRWDSWLQHPYLIPL
ncbi:RNA-directed DNA polymerase, eukaryota [Tanacetum coccineum]